MKKSILVLLFTLTSISCAQTKKAEKNIKYIDFELSQISSTETFKLSSLVGKNLILLNFWATWCPYCVKEIPELKMLHEKYKDKNFVILAVNIGEPKNKVLNFKNSYSIDYNILLDLNGSVARMYGVRGIPTNFLINQSGEIIFVDHYLPDEKLIEDNLLKFKKETKTKKEKK